MDITKAATVFLCLIAVVAAAEHEQYSSRVFFYDSPVAGSRYLKLTPQQLQPLSLPALTASLSALLGVPVPPTTTAEASSEVNSLLVADPFHRPHNVLLLLLPPAGDTTAAAAAAAHLPGYAALRSVQLQPSELAASAAAEEEESVSDLEAQLLTHFAHLAHRHTMPLPVTDCSAGAEEEALSCIRSALPSSSPAQPHLITAHLHSTQDVSSLVSLIAQQESADAGTDFVTVAVIPSATSPSLHLLPSRLSSRSSRVLLSSSSLTSEASEAAQVASRAVAIAGAIVLIVAFSLAISFLFNMPLTKDTLLYATTKLD